MAHTEKRNVHMEYIDTGGGGDARRATRIRVKPGDMGGGEANGQSIEMAHQYGWNNGWPEHLTENELIQAATMPSISPNVLRPGAIGVRPVLAISGYTAAQMSNMGGGGGGHNQTTLEVDEGLMNPNQVKFVNATVEILQNQIRKEEAPKKKRTRTTPEQLRILQKSFSADPMPNSSARLALAKKLGMNARAVQVWFQNRRAKEKLEAKRAEAGHLRERAGSLQSTNSTVAVVKVDSKEKSDHAAYLRNIQSAVSKSNSIGRTEEDNSIESHPPAYDLGMYFGDHALAQYSASFDLGAYNYAMDNLPQPQLFDDLDASEDSTGDGTNVDESSNAPYTRFQSMPMVGFSYAGPGISNTLGLVFNGVPNEELKDPTTPNKESPSSFAHRSNSIDVLGMMGEAAALDAQGKIFSTPASREAFLTAPLGQSIPMPSKQRSLSVPEIPNLSLRSQNIITTDSREVSPLFRGNDLLSIREEDASTNDAPPPPTTTKQFSNSVTPSSSLLEAFPGMQSMVALDDIQAYLDGMSNDL